MKTSLALLTVAALILVTAPAHGDQAGAREKLRKEGVAFTPEAFLQKVAEGDAGHVALFLEAGIDPTVKDGMNRTALWIATEQKQLTVLKALLAAGARLGEHKQALIEAAKDSEIRALLEAAE